MASGLIDLEDAVTISKVASDKNQTPEEFYQEFFESEQKRLRLEEEKTFDDSIGMDKLTSGVSSDCFRRISGFHRCPMKSKLSFTD